MVKALRFEYIKAHKSPVSIPHLLQYVLDLCETVFHSVEIVNGLLRPEEERMDRLRTSESGRAVRLA